MISLFLLKLGVEIMNTNKFKIFLFIIILLFSLTLIAFSSDLTTHYLDVGQADSIFIQLPNGQNMLIDAGNNEDGDKAELYDDSGKLVSNY